MESHAFPQPPAIEKDPRPFDGSWPSDVEVAERAEEPGPTPARIAMPIAIAAGVFGLALLGISQLLKRRHGHGKSSFIADALRSVSLSVLGVVASRVTERLASPPLLGPGSDSRSR
jgi:hypothetical protein